MKLAVLLQYLLPKQAITTIAGHFAHWHGGAITTTVIRWFVKRYQVNMQEAEYPEISHYKTFNAFFTRPLKADARPISVADLICPVDGAISQFGPINNDQIFQAKGHQYSTTDLVGGDDALAMQFNNGHFACLYLSPKDYHRIHMPCDGTLISMTYVPGALFSVNPTTAEGVAGLFARNERVICVFDSALHGRFVMVLVGATVVGSMATVWHDAKEGIINPPRSKKTCVWQYDGKNIQLKQGEEMGSFLLGSTVVLLFQDCKIAFNPTWQATKKICLGEVMANIVN